MSDWGLVTVILSATLNVALTLFYMQLARKLEDHRSVMKAVTGILTAAICGDELCQNACKRAYEEQK